MMRTQRKQSTKSVLESRCFGFFPRNSWKARANNFLFSYCCKLQGYTFTAKVIKITSSCQMFRPDPHLATKQSYYFKKHHFFQYRLRSYFCRLYCWFHYSASFWINLLSSVCAYTLKFAFPNLPKLAYLVLSSPKKLLLLLILLLPLLLL